MPSLATADGLAALAIILGLYEEPRYRRLRRRSLEWRYLETLAVRVHMRDTREWVVSR